MKDCKCKSCKNACIYKPGWFLPEQISLLLKEFEVKKIRELLEIKKVVIDWYEGCGNNILLLAPNIKHNNEIYYPGDPKGKCIFYNNSICNIHDIKPYECIEYHHNEKREDVSKRHKYVSEKWKETKVLEEFRSEIVMDDYEDDGLLSGMVGNYFY